MMSLDNQGDLEKTTLADPNKRDVGAVIRKIGARFSRNKPNNVVTPTPNKRAELDRLKVIRWGLSQMTAEKTQTDDLSHESMGPSEKEKLVAQHTQAKIVFASTIVEDKRTAVINELAARAVHDEKKILLEGIVLKQKSEVEIKTIDSLNRKAAQTLTMLGCDKEMLKLLPLPEQVGLLENSHVSFASPFGEALYIAAAEGQSLTSPEAQQYFFHELFHFLGKRVVKMDRSGIEGASLTVMGKDFSISQTGFLEPGKFKTTAVFEEGLSQLFSALCSDQPISITYREILAFNIAFAQKFAEKLGVTPLTALAKLIKANLQADESIFDEIRSAFGNEFVDTIRNSLIDPLVKPLPEITVFSTAAEKGGFSEEYDSLENSLFSKWKIQIALSQVFDSGKQTGGLGS